MIIYIIRRNLFCMETAQTDTAQNQIALLEQASSDIAAKLQQHARDARGAFSLNTVRALRSDTAVFTGWCAGQNFRSMPADPVTVADFVDAMGEAKSPATVRRYVSSVATFHKAAGEPNPCEAPAVQLALKRLHRDKGRAQQQAAGLTRRLVDRMLDLSAPGLRALRDRALLAVAYDTLARRSELVGLQVADMEAAPDGSAVVTIRRSKTDQEGEGAVCYLAPDTAAHVATYLAAAGSVTGGPLFRSVSKAGGLGGGLDAGDVARIFKRMGEAAGIPAELVARISGHSSRVGAAQDMVAENVELAGIMAAGRWRTPVMVGRYTAKVAVRRGAAFKLAAAQNRA